MPEVSGRGTGAVTVTIGGAQPMGASVGERIEEGAFEAPIAGEVQP